MRRLIEIATEQMARAFLPDDQAMKDVVAHVMTLRDPQ